MAHGDDGSGVPLIEGQAAFEGAIARLAGAGRLAVDTEAASFHRYRDRVYLLQLSTERETLIVDPLGVPDLSRFGSVLADPAVEIIFHDADYDLRLLEQEFGFRATHLFDTRVAAQFLNEPGIGLAALLEKYLNIKLDKKFQRADWSQRPLSVGMLEYAASDTKYLPQLRDILGEQLAAIGRSAWVEEEFALLENARHAGDPDPEPAWLRMKGAKALRPRQLAVFRELFGWRDSLAAELDRAPFRIMNNDVLLALAQDPPAGAGELASRRGVGRENAERRSGDIMAAIGRGLAVAEADLPRVPRTRRRSPDPEYDARLERLKAARNEAARRLELAPGVLCANGVLEGIARLSPQSVEGLAEVPGMRRWQREVLGAELLGALKAP